MHRSIPAVRSAAVVRPGLLSAILCIAFATAAHAQLPSPANCSVPAGITLVGTNGAVPDPQGSFTIVVRDAANTPIAGAAINIFVNAPGVKVGTSPFSPGALVVACSPPSALAVAVTDPQGRATLELGGAVKSFVRIVGPTVKILANGVTIGSSKVATFDLAGMDGLNINDVSKWLGIFGSGVFTTQADYNLSGVVDIGDLSILMGALGAAGSSLPSAAYCP